MQVNKRIREEFRSFAADKVNDGIVTLDNQDDWHYHLFNADYYIIGYYNSSQWLKHHGFGELEAANFCVQYEKDNFGEAAQEYNNTEKVANMCAYILGEEWLCEEGEDFILGLLEAEADAE